MTGGMKCLVEHLRLLKMRGKALCMLLAKPIPSLWSTDDAEKAADILLQDLRDSMVISGHTTIAAHRSDTAQRAMPPWTDVKPDVDLVCKLHERLSDVYNVQDIDVVVVGIFHQVSCPAHAFHHVRAFIWMPVVRIRQII